MSKQSDFSDLHQKILQDFYKAESSVIEERRQCLADRRFCSISGAQWEGNLSKIYENKPKFEINKIQMAVNKLVTEFRNNDFRISFLSRNGDIPSTQLDFVAGLYRSDEQESCAVEAYSNAAEEAFSGGFGAYRVRAVLENEEDEDCDDLRVRFEPIYDADSCVFFDPNSKMMDKSDAEYCFVITPMSLDAYKEQYDDDPASWPKSVESGFFDFESKQDFVNIAEYYKIEKKSEKVYVYRHLSGDEQKYTDDDFEQNEELKAFLQATDSKLIETKKRKTKKVHKYILSGGKILSDEGYVPGKHLPIIPMYGKRWFVDGIERCAGEVRLARDSQRISNMVMSKLAEISVHSPVRKPIFTPDQVIGHQQLWANDHIENPPFLLVNPMNDPVTGQMLPSGPLGYTEPPSLPPSLVALIQTADTSIKELLGYNEQAEKITGNVSTRTVEMVQQRVDQKAYIYLSNAARSLCRGAEVWLSMAKECYFKKEKSMRVIEPDGQSSSIKLMEPSIDVTTGKIIYANDLSCCDMIVVSEIAPSFKSRKDATVSALTNMLPMIQDPEFAQVIQSMILVNMDGEGLDDIRKFMRKRLVSMGVYKPTEEESMEMQAAAEAAASKKDPNAMLLEAAAMEAMAKADKAKFDSAKSATEAELTRAKTLETRAKTAEILSNVGINSQSHALNVARELTSSGDQKGSGQ